MSRLEEYPRLTVGRAIELLSKFDKDSELFICQVGICEETNIFFEVSDYKDDSAITFDKRVNKVTINFLWEDLQ